MAWKEIHEITTRNGRMSLVKIFGAERLLAQDNVQQSGSYMNGVWRTGFRALPQKYMPKNIVFLGVGLGGALALAAKKFPSAHITGIEWDATLCELARNRLKKYPHIEIITADAETWVKNMEYTDLVLVDLFTGADVAPCVRNTAFLPHIITRAHTTLINVYTHTDILECVDNTIAPRPHKRLQYHASTLGMYGSPHLRK